MRVLHIQPDSEEWLDWRRTGIGASDVPKILGTSHYGDREDVIESKLFVLQQLDSGAMERGRRLEVVARKLYCERYSVTVRPTFIQHSEYPWMIASLDGLSEDRQLAVEIKAPNATYHTLALRGKLPLQYLDQCQYQLLILGLPVMDYVSFTDNNRFVEDERFVVVRVPADAKRQQQIFAEAQATWEEILQRLEATRSAQEPATT